jgi:hypothetical protein
MAKIVLMIGAFLMVWSSNATVEAGGLMSYGANNGVSGEARAIGVGSARWT